MNKHDILVEIRDGLKSRQNIDVTLDQAEAVLDDFFALTLDRARDGEDTKWPTIGTFKSHDQAARTARNPATGETIQVPAKTVLKLSVASPAKKFVNGE